jgi:hypothetical protein
MTQKEVGQQVFCSDSLISGIENGTKPAKQELIERIDAEVKAGGMIVAAHPITMLGGYPAEFVASQEAEATKIHGWEPRMVPGLAQSAEYAHAIMRAVRPGDSDESIEADVQSRIERQDIFTRANPPTVWFVIDESVLYRPFGGKDVMYKQLLKLEELAGMPNVFVQVMRFTSTAHPGTEGPLRIIEFRDNPPIWYTEGWFSGRMTEAKDEVSEAMTWFDLIRASALSIDQTMRLIAKIRTSRYE